MRKKIINYIHALSFILLFMLLSQCQTSLLAQSNPAEGALYNIYVDRGITTPKGFLSVKGDDVDLWHKDDGDGRQKWEFIKVGESNEGSFYHIRVYSTASDYRLLSTNEGGGINTWHTDDGSGRQHWLLRDIGDGKFHIIVRSGTCCGRVYLSCRSEDGQVDLYTHDDNSGRQQWVLEHEKVPFSKVAFNLREARTYQTKPFTTKIDFSHEPENPDYQRETFSIKVENSSSFQSKSSFTFEVPSNTYIQIPSISKGELYINPSSNKIWRYPSSGEQKEETRSYQTGGLVNPKEKATVYLENLAYEVIVPYTAYGKSRITGENVSINGVWKGILVDEFEYRFFMK